MGSIPDIGSISATPAPVAREGDRAVRVRRRSVFGGLACAVLLMAARAAGAQSVSFGDQPVGATSGERNVTLQASAAGTVATVEILTLGIPNLDFAAGIGAETCASATLAVHDNCIVSVTFTPAAPGLRSGAVVLLDSGGRVLATTYLAGTGTGGLGVLRMGNILPVAGNGGSGTPVLDGGQATDATLDTPSGVAIDGAGNLYIADTGHNRIRKVTVATGVISTVAGNGVTGYAGDGLAATDPAVSVNAPAGVALDGAGNLYIADTGNHAVREIDAATGILSTRAGTGTQGAGGDGGLATAATLNQPRAVALDASGNLYIADTGNHRIRVVSALTGDISALAGSGTRGSSGDGGAASQAELDVPAAVAFDAAGNLYIADTGNNAVRAVGATAGVVGPSSILNAFAGSGAAGYSGDGSPATSATLSSPSGVAADPAGNLYIADTGNSALRRVSAATGLISTIALNNSGEYLDNNGGPYAVHINGPLGLALDAGGDLYFADALNHRVRTLQSNFALLDYSATPVGQGRQSAAQSLTIDNDGNAPLTLQAITAGSNAALAAATTCAAGSGSLAIDAECALAAVFAPSAAGDPLEGQIGVTTPANNAPLTIELLGDATPVAPSTTTLASALNPSGFGQAVTLTAAVGSSGSLTGTVSFYDGGAQLGSAVGVSASGMASVQIGSLAVGIHTLTAVYSGDTTHAASTSAALSQTVLEGTSTTLVSSANPASPHQQVTLTATVAALGGGGVQPQGTVTFADGAATLAVVALNASGVAAYSTAALAAGSHAMIATYSGDAAHQVSGSVSVLTTEEVLQSSQTTLSAAPNPSLVNSPVTFTITVQAAQAPTPTGAFLVLDGATQIGAGNLAGGSGTLMTSLLAVGAHSLTAVYLGDAANAGSTSAALVQMVNPAATTTTLAAAPNPAIAAAPVSLFATVQPAPGMPRPTGTVNFTDTFNGTAMVLGSEILGSGNLTSGAAILTHAFAAGTHSILAAYSGNADQAAGVSAPLSLIVQPVAVSLAVTSSNDPSLAGSAVTFTARLADTAVAPTGTVSFMADGASIGTAAINASGTAALTVASLAPGSHQVVAVYAGDAVNAAATSLEILQVVDLIPTATALTVTPPSAADLTAALNVEVTNSASDGGPAPTGTVTFLVGATVVGSAQLGPGGALTFTPNLTPGTVVLVASYGGDAVHGPSASTAVLLLTPPNTFSLAVAPNTFSMTGGQTVTATVSLAASGTFTDTIALGCSGLPPGLGCRFSQPSVVLPALGTASVELTLDNDPQTATAAIGGNSRHTPPLLASLGVPLCLAFGLIWARLRRRRGGWPVLAGLVLAGPVLAGPVLLGTLAPLATGCTSVHLNGPRPGSYVIQVTGTGVKTGLVQSQSLHISVTQ